MRDEAYRVSDNPNIAKVIDEERILQAGCLIGKEEGYRIINRTFMRLLGTVFLTAKDKGLKELLVVADGKFTPDYQELVRRRCSFSKENEGVYDFMAQDFMRWVSENPQTTIVEEGTYEVRGEELFLKIRDFENFATRPSLLKPEFAINTSTHNGR
ncbi:hypothetical protein COU61_01125 [Candidatus Pacearchaeota archaeon CG10_big_fil_rev_8_21_14_0_10_35_13]|nr:MAG: hypothetical protein COU61_01125 [Candidatus Pacearchaeota archaeon CG10_big_fil_rev_8_21_14_0_10_35_13]